MIDERKNEKEEVLKVIRQRKSKQQEFINHVTSGIEINILKASIIGSEHANYKNYGSFAQMLQ